MSEVVSIVSTCAEKGSADGYLRMLHVRDVRQCYLWQV